MKGGPPIDSSEIMEGGAPVLGLLRPLLPFEFGAPTQIELVLGQWLQLVFFAGSISRFPRR